MAWLSEKRAPVGAGVDGRGMVFGKALGSSGFANRVLAFLQQQRIAAE
jgi:hypothetical protein